MASINTIIDANSTEITGALDTIKEINVFLTGNDADGKNVGGVLLTELNKKMNLGVSTARQNQTVEDNITFTQAITASGGVTGNASTATKLAGTFRLGTNLSTDNKGDEDYVEIDGSTNKELKPKMVGLTVASNGSHTLLGGNAASSAAAHTDNMIMTAAEHVN